jgi:phosphate transport system substrate-binding protein
MSKISKISVFVFVSFLFFACQKEQKKQGKETILKGSVSIFVDETLVPVIEDQVAVFESNYEAKIKLMPKSETEAVNSLFKEKSPIAILARDLSVEEMKIFDQKKNQA